jgi:hypothetical protein
MKCSPYLSPTQHALCLSQKPHLVCLWHHSFFTRPSLKHNTALYTTNLSVSSLTKIVFDTLVQITKFPCSSALSSEDLHLNNSLTFNVQSFKGQSSPSGQSILGI